MLQFESAWRYESPGAMPAEVVEEIFTQVIARTAMPGSRQDVYELFKRCFARAAGRSAGRSSSEDWAETDLRDYMQSAADNAPLFVEALHDGLMEVSARQPHGGPPPWNFVNGVLASSGYAITPPHLTVGQALTPVSVPERVPSLDQMANEKIQRSLAESAKLLNAGKYRPAVQEILWLLETVSTAFAGSEHEDGTVTGKYFNKIIGDLKRLHRGRVLAQVVSWMENLHGYLSSPTGGAIRHGGVLSDAYELSEGEARLFCDLTRSYLSYMLHEHQRLVAGSGHQPW